MRAARCTQAHAHARTHAPTHSTHSTRQTKKLKNRTKSKRIEKRNAKRKRKTELNNKKPPTPVTKSVSQCRASQSSRSVPENQSSQPVSQSVSQSIRTSTSRPAGQSSLLLPPSNPPARLPHWDLPLGFRASPPPSHLFHCPLPFPLPFPATPSSGMRQPAITNAHPPTAENARVQAMNSLNFSPMPPPPSPPPPPPPPPLESCRVPDREYLDSKAEV